MHAAAGRSGLKLAMNSPDANMASNPSLQIISTSKTGSKLHRVGAGMEEVEAIQAEKRVEYVIVIFNKREKETDWKRRGGKKAKLKNQSLNRLRKREKKEEEEKRSLLIFFQCLNERTLFSFTPDVHCIVPT